MNNNDYSLMSHQTSWDCWTYVDSAFDLCKVSQIYEVPYNVCETRDVTLT